MLVKVSGHVYEFMHIQSVDGHYVFLHKSQRQQQQYGGKEVLFSCSEKGHPPFVLYISFPTSQILGTNGNILRFCSISPVKRSIISLENDSSSGLNFLELELQNTVIDHLGGRSCI